ncbi:hypothetical protein WJX77_009772 [Trebouxia sp. C0004]
MFRLVYSGEGATQPLVDDSSLTKEQKAKTATAEARQCEEADPSCSASTLSNEEYASLLDAAMRFPDKQVGLCVAAMVSCGLAAGFRSDDLQDTRYFMELICSVLAEPLPMQILALARNAGKANQVAATMPDTLVKTKVMHLMRCSGTVSLAAAACSMDVLQVWGRWARQTSVASIALSPPSTWLKHFGRAAPLCCKGTAWAGGHCSCPRYVSLWAVLHSVNLSNR